MNTVNRILAAAVLAVSMAFFVPFAAAQNLNLPGGQLNNFNTPSGFQGGQWLPLVATLTSTNSFTMSTQAGTYEIIGRQVTVRFNAVTSTSTTGASGQLLMTGLPVAAGSSSSDYGVCNLDQFGGVTLDAGFGGAAGTISPGTATIQFTESGSGKAFQNLLVNNVNTNGGSLTLVGSCVYHSP